MPRLTQIPPHTCEPVPNKRSTMLAGSKDKGGGLAAGVCAFMVCGLMIWTFTASPAGSIAVASNDQAAQRTPHERRFEVIRAIRQGEDGVAALARALEDEAALVRMAAVRGLGTVGGEQALALLEMALEREPAFAIRHRVMLELQGHDALTPEQVAAQVLPALRPSLDVDKGDGEQELTEVGWAAKLIRDWQFVPGPRGAELFLAMFEPDFASEHYSVNGVSVHGEITSAPGGPKGRSLRISSQEAVNRQNALRLSRNMPALTPNGAFSIEFWLLPDAALFEARSAFLVDKMGSGRAATDYVMRLVRESEQTHRVHVTLGFGSEAGISRYQSEPITLVADQWHHLVFTYDGQGLGRIHLDGRLVGAERHPTRGSIAPGTQNLAIGDRTVAHHAPFLGTIGAVRIHHERISVR